MKEKYETIKSVTEPIVTLTPMEVELSTYEVPNGIHNYDDSFVPDLFTYTT